MGEKRRIHRLVVLGEGGVGKTALTIQLCLSHFVETYDPTIEDSYQKQAQIDGQPCTLEVLDTAGQEGYITLRDEWIRQGDGFILVYSISSRESFNAIKRLYEQIQRVRESTLDGPLPQLSSIPSENSIDPVLPNHGPVILVGNKCDLVGDRKVSIREGKALGKELRCDFLEASAKYNINVEKAFYDVVRELMAQNKQAKSTSKRRILRSRLSGSLQSSGHKKGDKSISERRLADGPVCAIL